MERVNTGSGLKRPARNPVRFDPMLLGSRVALLNTTWFDIQKCCFLLIQCVTVCISSDCSVDCINYFGSVTDVRHVYCFVASQVTLEFQFSSSFPNHLPRLLQGDGIAQLV